MHQINMIKSILKYSSIALLIIIGNLIIIIPGIYKIILPRETFGLFEFYSESVYFIRIIILIIVQLVIFFYLKNRKLSLNKSMIPIFIFFFIIIIILEHPKIFNQEILYKKSLEAKFEYSSLDYYKSLPMQTKYEIYKTVIDKWTPCILVDSLSNNTGFSPYYSHPLMPISDSLLTIFKHSWDKNKLPNIIISDYKHVIDSNHQVIGDYNGLLTLTPIKLIDNKIIIGYQLYSNPLGAQGGYYRCLKKDNKWSLISIGHFWIS